MLLDVVVGGQYGSEAKGHVTQRLVNRHVEAGRQVVNVRVAGPNAGHTAHTPDGLRAVAFRQLPVGALTPGVTCAIAAGSEIDPPVLIDEIHRAEKLGFNPRNLYVDPEATIITYLHKEVESAVDLVGRVGSTGKGIGAARGDRIMRRAKRVIDDELAGKLQSLGVNVMTTRFGETITDRSHDAMVIEGTQGYGLGLHAGMYPYCTSSDCRAIDFMAMAGVSPWHIGITGLTIWVVCRVFPIRVAGNSGPLAGETSWQELGLPEERTTVTQKIRRVGRWDPALVANAVRANGGGPTVRLAITMLDQWFGELRDVSGGDKLWQHNRLWEWIGQVQAETQAKVGLVTTGPNTGVFL